MEVQNIPQPQKAINILFRKFSSYKLALKEIRSRLESKKKAASLLPKLDELEKEAATLQNVKNQYTFGDSENAKTLSKIFARGLEEFEFKFSKFKNEASELNA